MITRNKFIAALATLFGSLFFWRSKTAASVPAITGGIIKPTNTGMEVNISYARTIRAVDVKGDDAAYYIVAGDPYMCIQIKRMGQIVSPDMLGARARAVRLNGVWLYPVTEQRIHDALEGDWKLANVQPSNPEQQAIHGPMPFQPAPVNAPHTRRIDMPYVK